MRRRIVPLTAAAALLATVVTGCTSTPSGSADLASCEAPLSPGALSSSVQITGETADTLRVSVGRDLQANRAERSVLTPENTSDRVATEGSIVVANLGYVNASNGELLSVSPTFGTARGDTPFIAEVDMGSIAAGTVCAREGDTLAIVLSPEEGASLGLDESIIVIAEIAAVAAPHAEGQLRALASGFPAVTTDHTGQPGIVLPPQEAPSETRSALRILGTGETVKAEDSVIGQILTVGWGGTIERNSWSTGPLNLGNEAGASTPQSSFRTELTGVPVGSQVVVIEPAEGGARVSVIDILATF